MAKDERNRVLTVGAKVWVRLRQDPDNTYRGEVVALWDGRRRRVETLDSRKRKGMVEAHVVHHCGVRNCFVGGTVAQGYDEVWIRDAE